MITVLIDLTRWKSGINHAQALNEILFSLRNENLNTWSKCSCICSDMNCVVEKDSLSYSVIETLYNATREVKEMG